MCREDTKTSFIDILKWKDIIARIVYNLVEYWVLSARGLSTQY